MKANPFRNDEFDEFIYLTREIRRTRRRRIHKYTNRLRNLLVLQIKK